jgi:hypothetical protein
VAADLHPYSLHSLGLWWLREIPATLVALWEISPLQAQACQSADRTGQTEEAAIHES